ncbi:hypothetical protein FKM82_026474, partial [Ascaphus truei]
EVLLFKKPSMRPIPRNRLRTFDGGDEKDTFSQRANSAPAVMCFTPEKDDFQMDNTSPVCLRKTSLTFSMCHDEDDDGFMEILDGEDLKGDADMPPGMENLLTAPLVKNTEESDT